MNEHTSRTGKVAPEPHLEDTLHMQPEWFRVTLSSIADAVIITDADAQITFLNPVAESLTGWTLEEATGRPLDSVFRIINENSRQPVENPAVRALRDGVLVGLANHSLLIANDGTERPIDDSAAPIRNDKGEVAGVVLVFRDIAERRQQEQKVQEVLAYAENIIATLREPFIVLDKGLRVQTANAAFYRTFHVSPEQTEGRFVYDLGNGQWNIPSLRVLLDAVLSNNNHSFEDFEVEHDFPGIGTKIVLLHARRFESADNRPDLILLAIEDLTEHKNAQIAVNTSEVQYRRLFETAKDGILILDANTGKIIDANPFMSELLGYPHEEFLGKELWEIGLFSEKSANEAAFRELQQHGYVRYHNLPLESSTGRHAEVEFVSNLYQVGRRRVAQCNIRDISERSRLERQTKEQAVELAELDQRKDEFLAMLSHELRNPLAPISNAAHLLRLQKDQNSIQRHAREIIERQVGNLSHLVDELLEVSRITTGKIHLHRERVAASGLVEHAVEMVRPLIDQRRQDLTVSLSPEPIWLHVDATRLQQVVVNLLNNAAKYSNEGGQIWLAIQQDGDKCVLRVRDTGVGIAPALLPRIFDLFTQASRSLDRSRGGLGIGLAVARRLVELHGGTVEAYSALDRGSEFVVRLPMMLASATQPPPPQIEEVKRTGPSLRLLVVDDSVDTVESLAMLLTTLGHEVRTANDGLTAAQAVLDYRPNAVLLDIGLPGLDGYEVAKQIRQQPTLKEVVLIAVTGYGQETDRQRSMEAGFDHHLAKPATFKNVQQILETISETRDG